MRYLLENEQLRVEVDTLGAEVKSVKDKETQFFDGELQEREYTNTLAAGECFEKEYTITVGRTGDGFMSEVFR